MATGPTEQQLKNREIAAGGGTPVESAFDSDSFISSAASRLLETSGIISSADSSLEDAILRTQKAGEATTTRIESAFGREKEFQAGQFDQQRTTEIEAQRGFARNSSALRLLDERTEKSLRDLDQRKEELILAGEAASAERITNLQIKEIEFRQRAAQQVFNNLLAASSFGLQAKQEERLGAAQSFAERNIIANLGLEFGIEVPEGATLEEIVALAAPRANAKRKAELAKIIADTNRIKAETTKALRGEKIVLDSVIAAGFASTLNSLAVSADRTAIESIGAILKSVEDQYGAAGLSMVKAFQLADSEERFTDDNLRKEIQDDFDSGESTGTIIQAIEDNVIMNDEQKERARKIVKELTPPRTPISFESAGGFLYSVESFFTGTVLGEPNLARFNELDRRFRRGATMSKEDMAEFRKLGKGLGKF